MGGSQSSIPRPTAYPSSQSPKNIVVFGESGHGKSSVVNMLLQANKAKISNSAMGCTPESTPYPLKIDGQELVLWDTAGLNEPEGGRVPAAQAVVALYDLLRNLSTQGGVTLLMYIIRGRVTTSTGPNWDFFHRIICRRLVPSLLVVTGLEDVQNLDSWWKSNQGSFVGAGIRASNYACITSFRGANLGLRRGRVYDSQYEASRRRLQESIVQTISGSIKPLEIEASVWFQTVVFEVTEMTGGCLWTREIRYQKERTELVDEAIKLLKIHPEVSANLDGYSAVIEKLRSQGGLVGEAAWNAPRVASNVSYISASQANSTTRPNRISQAPPRRPDDVTIAVVQSGSMEPAAWSVPRVASNAPPRRRDDLTVSRVEDEWPIQGYGS